MSSLICQSLSRLAIVGLHDKEKCDFFFLFCAAYNTYSMWVQDSRGQRLNNNCLRFSFKLEEKASA